MALLQQGDELFEHPGDAARLLAVHGDLVAPYDDPGRRKGIFHQAELFVPLAEQLSHQAVARNAYLHDVLSGWGGMAGAVACADDVARQFGSGADGAVDGPHTVAPMVRHPRGEDTNGGEGTPEGLGGPEGGLPGDADLTRFAAASRTREAVRARSREHWLRQQVLEGATLAGACRSLAEAGQPVALTTVAGRTHHGRVRSLGEDFVSLVVPGGREVLLPLERVAVLEPGRPDGPVGRAPTSGSTLVEAVAHLVVDRPLVTVWCLGAAVPVVGELVGSSAELMMIGPHRAEPRAVAYVRLSAVVELSVSASG